MEVFTIALIFALIAFLYASAGFGGGSSYLAVLAIFGVAFIEMRFIALACNILVVAGSSFLFIKKGLINWSKLKPLVLLSIPLAYLGGMIRITASDFFILLGISLIIAGPAMILRSKMPATDKTFNNKYLNGLLGGGIGLLSGIVGIGGGIFLAPVLHLMKWDKPKEIAATTSFFILVNSVSGLLGQMNNVKFQIDTVLLFSCLGAVLIGGQMGVRLSVRNLSPKHLSWLTAILVFLVGIRVLIKSFS